MMNKNFKNLCALTLSLTCSACNVNDKNINPADVPPTVIAALEDKYPGATEITWERERDGADTVFEATFRYEGKKMDAEFDRNGKPAEKD